MARRGGLSTRELFVELGGAVEAAALKALAEGAEMVVAEAKSRVSVKSGKLKESIHAIPMSKGQKYKIVSDAKNSAGNQYAQFVEWSPKINKPFLYPAMDSKRAEIKQRIIDAIREADKHAKR